MQKRLSSTLLQTPTLRMQSTVICVLYSVNYEDLIITNQGRLSQAVGTHCTHSCG